MAQTAFFNNTRDPGPDLLSLKGVRATDLGQTA